MTVRKLVCVLAFAVLCAASALAADPAPAAPAAKAPATTAAAAKADPPAVEAAEKPLEWKDYKVKAYTLSFYGGSFSGATYLDLKPISDRTVVTAGGYTVFAYDGIGDDGKGHLAEADNMIASDPLARKYNAPRKEIEPGTAFGGRIGIYLADDFHLDLVGSYFSGRAVTTMDFNPDKTNPANTWNRIEVDEDTGFRAYKGGVSLMYDATPATIFGVKPLLGFGLGGIINRFSVLEDKTALYLEGNFGLSVRPAKNLEVIARTDVAVFAFEVDELGYSNMVNYKDYMIGVSWFLDTVPADVRAKHLAAPKPKR